MMQALTYGKDTKNQRINPIRPVAKRANRTTLRQCLKITDK